MGKLQDDAYELSPVDLSTRQPERNWSVEDSGWYSRWCDFGLGFYCILV